VGHTRVTKRRIHSYAGSLIRACTPTDARAVPIALMVRSRVKEINRPCHSKSRQSPSPRRTVRAIEHRARERERERERDSRARLYTRIVFDDVSEKRPNRTHTFIIDNTKESGKGSTRERERERERETERDRGGGRKGAPRRCKVGLLMALV